MNIGAHPYCTHVSSACIMYTAIRDVFCFFLPNILSTYVYETGYGLTGALFFVPNLYTHHHDNMLRMCTTRYAKDFSSQFSRSIRVNIHELFQERGDAVRFIRANAIHITHVC